MRTVAIIGTGNISGFHLDGYIAFPERCKIIALCDIVPEKCKAKKQKYGLDGAAVYASHTEMLNSLAGKLDLVSICMPPFCHAEIAVDCLNAGVNVLVEKPMATSLAECDVMIDAAKRNGKTLAVVAQNRFRTPIMNLKKTLDAGLIGRVLHAQIDSHWWRGHSYYDLWWRGTWEKEGGGCTLNHAVHHIDMLGWVLGLPEAVCAMLANTAHDNAEVEDLSVAVLRYAASPLTAKGALAQITSSVVHHGEEQQIIFQGETARISAPWKVTANTASPDAFPADDSVAASHIAELNTFYDALPRLNYTAHTGEIDNVLASLEGTDTLLVDGAAGRRTIELITAIYKAGASAVTVALPLSKSDPFYTAAGIVAAAPRFYQKTTSVKDFGG
ncbi:oxidoreductase [Spirochaetia bacterium]|nr:oxidoreductase [Spirochaetia bacterium]GHU37583.1 oxidoreductase [Spirochaetia bacterium]